MSARIERHVLPSGLTLLVHPMPDRRSVSVGVWVRTGARDESPVRLGITHFLEHMMFKGTATRDARAIAESLESLGGHLDAFTTREQVCFAARALSEHLPQAIDVLSDITCQSRFEPREIEREKSVVKEEILSYEDNPEEKVGDLLAALAWGDHALGRPILGTADTVDALDRDALVEHFRGRFRADQIIVAAAGGLTLEDLLPLVERGFRTPDGEAPVPDGPPPPPRPAVQHEVRDLQQLYLSLAGRSVAYGDPRRYALVVLETLLGGGMSSRLFQSIREEAGLAYSIFSTLDFMRDGGLVSIHMGVSPDRARQALALLREELVRIAGEGPTVAELESTRQQLKGSLTIGQESTSGRMYHMARQELYTGRYASPDEQVARILAVSHEQVKAVAAEFFAPERFALAALGPAPGGPLGPADWPGGVAGS